MLRGVPLPGPQTPAPPSFMKKPSGEARLGGLRDRRGEVVLLGRREPGSQVGVALRDGVSGWSAGSAP
ncbi:MAG: hypothetical protein ACTSV0_00900 [Candidatus Freyarchaeota archaeon]